MNALQAPREGGSERRLIIETSHRAKEVTLCISDDGPGIAEDDSSKIFEPFFTTTSEGMGMGLSMCRTIVESHAAAVSASNNPGVGESEVGRRSGRGNGWQDG